MEKITNIPWFDKKPVDGSLSPLLGKVGIVHYS